MTTSCILEAKGIGKVDLLLEVLTEDLERTRKQVEEVLQQHEGELATSGSVAPIFVRKGMIVVRTDDEERLMEVALGAGGEDFEMLEGRAVVVTPLDELETVVGALNKIFSVETSERPLIPIRTATLSEAESDRLLALLDALKAVPELIRVYHNGEPAGL